MKWILLILLAINGYNGIAQQQNKPVISRQILLKGAIDKYPITLRLYQVKNNFTGYYYYDNFEQPIEVSGQVKPGGKLELEKWAIEDKDAEIFNGLFDDNGYGGTWSARGKNLIFRLSPAKDSSLPFDYIYTYGQKKIKKREDIYRDQLIYEAAAVWPAANANHPAVPFIKHLIRKQFDDKSGEEDIGQLMLKQKKETLDTSKISGDDPNPYESNERIQVVFCNKQLLVLSDFNYGDFGGAHGNYGVAFICADLQNQKLLKINDVLDSARAHTLLEDLLEKQFRKDNHMKKEDSLNTLLLVDTIHVTNNFFLTSKGIGFSYDPYEIAAYVYGDIHIFIPFKDIDQFLRPAFKKLLEESK